MEPSCYNYQMEMWDQIYGNKGVCSYIYIYIWMFSISFTLFDGDLVLELGLGPTDIALIKWGLTLQQYIPIFDQFLWCTHQLQTWSLLALDFPPQLQFETLIYEQNNPTSMWIYIMNGLKINWKNNMIIFGAK